MNREQACEAYVTACLSLGVDYDEAKIMLRAVWVAQLRAEIARVENTDNTRPRAAKETP